MTTPQAIPPIVIIENRYPRTQVVPSQRPVDQETMTIHPSSSSPISLIDEAPLELPPTFRRIVNEIKIKDPALIEHRYREFVEIENRQASTPVQGGGQVKLFHPGGKQF